MATVPNIENTDRLADYTAIASQTDFTIPWPVFGATTDEVVADLVVLVDGLRSNPDSLDFVGNSITGVAGVWNGGTLKLPAQTAGARVIIYSDRAPRRVGAFLEGKSLPFTTLDGLQDDFASQMRDIHLRTRRAITVPMDQYVAGVDPDTFGAEFTAAVVSAAEQAQAAAQSATQATLQPRITWVGYVANDSSKGAANRAALSAALVSAAAIGVLLAIPMNAGTIHFSDEVEIPNGTGIVYEVPGTALLDWSVAGTAGSYTHGACLYASGTFTALPALNADLTQAGRTSAVLASAPSGLSKGDCIFLVDKDTLFNSARVFYYEGEPVKVDSVSGATVNFLTSTFGAYKAATTKVNKLNPVKVTLDGVVIKAPSNKFIAGWMINAGRDCVVSNVATSNSNYAAGVFQYCVDCSFSDLNQSKAVVDGGLGNSYGLVFSNCHNVKGTGGVYISARHGVTMGGTDSDYAIVTRFVTVSNAYIAHWAQSDVAIYAADMHGNCQFCGYIDCFIDGGMDVGGDRNYIKGGTIRSGSFFGAQAPATAVELSECKSLNHIIAPDFIEVRGVNPANRDYGSVLNAGWSGSGIDSHTDTDGTLIFDPRYVDARPDASSGHQAFISVQNNGSTAKNKIVIGGRFNCASITTADYVASSIRVSSGNAFDTVDLRGAHGNLQWSISGVTNLVMDGADLNHVGLNKSSYTPAFDVGAGLYIHDCTSVSLVGVKLRGGKGKPLILNTIGSADLTGMATNGYDSGTSLTSVATLRLAPGDLAGLGITTVSCGAVRYLQGPHDGTVVIGASDWREAMAGPPTLEVDLSGVDQTGVAGTSAKINFSHVVVDSEGWWDAINHRYLPLIAGRYRVALKTAVTGISMTVGTPACLKKNGASIALGSYSDGLSNAASFDSVVVRDIDCNGTSDYIEAWVLGATGAASINGSTYRTNMHILRVR